MSSLYLGKSGSFSSGSIMGDSPPMERYNRQISDSHLEEFSRTHCKDWRRLPSHLGMDKAVADDIDHDGKEEKERRYNFLTKWKDEKGVDATYKSLTNALTWISCRNDAEYLCELMQRGESACEAKHGTVAASVTASATTTASLESTSLTDMPATQELATPPSVQITEPPGAASAGI